MDNLKSQVKEEKCQFEILTSTRKSIHPECCSKCEILDIPKKTTTFITITYKYVSPEILSYRLYFTFLEQKL